MNSNLPQRGVSKGKQSKRKKDPDAEAEAEEGEDEKEGKDEEDDDGDDGDCPDEPCKDDDSLIEGLSSTEINVLAQKIYDLLLDELRIESERHGRHTLR